MFEDFKRVLARVQTDYEFYIQCQANPAVALAGYDLSPDQRLTLGDPTKLADMLVRGIGIDEFHITITISGRHDWINRAVSAEGTPVDDADREARVLAELAAIKQAVTDDERAQAVTRLMEQIG